MNITCQNYNETHYLLPAYLLQNCSLYYQQNHLNPDSIETSTVISEKNPDFCINIERTCAEYRTAFFVNIICICFPFLVFYIMGSRELWTRLKRIETHLTSSYAKRLLAVIYWPLTVVFAPFFILYIAIRQLIYKFQHLKATRKNKYR